MKDDIFEEIEKNVEKSFLKIPTTMPRTFNRKEIEKYFPKDAAKKLDDVSEKSQFYESDGVKDMISKSGSETEQEKMQKLGNREVTIDLNNGDFFEQFFINRVDRDIFDLKYHSNISRPNEIDFSEMKSKNKEILSSKDLLENYKIYLDDVYSILSGNDLFENLLCKPDFLIKDVESKEIKAILNDPNKKYHVFGNEALFVEDKYDLFGEITIDLFKPEIYINKVKQLLKYIIVIKLKEKNNIFFNDKVKKALMIVTNGKYLDFIKKISTAKIYTNESISDELDFSSINDIKIKSNNLAKKFKEYKRNIFDFHNQFSLSKKNIARNSSSLNAESARISGLYKNLEDHTLNFLKILKYSKIPFILCYFPKIGDELPYKLYKTARLSISKMNIKEYETKYIFSYDINEEIKKLSEENKILKAEFHKKDDEFHKKDDEFHKKDEEFKKKDEEFQKLNFKFNILFMFFIFVMVFIFFMFFYSKKYFK